MIFSNQGTAQLKGSVSTLVTDYELILESLKKAGFTEEILIDVIKEVFRVKKGKNNKYSKEYSQKLNKFLRERLLDNLIQNEK